MTRAEGTVHRAASAGARELFQTPDSRSHDFELLSDVQTRLDRALDGVALVCAPAGYGKTTQVASWVANESRVVVWVDLGQRDNDSGLLAARLTSMLHGTTGLVGEQVDRRAGDAHPLMTLTAVTGLVGALEQPLVVVFDDVHEIDDRSSLDLLVAVASNLPAGSTVVLIGRSEPALQFVPLRVAGRIVDITVTELALTAFHARAIFESWGLEVDEPRLEQYVEAAEGWPVGLQLAALALRDDAELPPDALARDRILAALVHDQWLRGLDSDDTDFLLRVSGLDWMSGELCDDVLQRSDSGARLERLCRSRLLVTPLDRRGEAFRLHALLRDVLDADFERLERTARRDIDRRAAAWFERHGDIDRAIHHAVRAGDDALVEELIVRYAVSVHTRGGYRTVRRWLDQIPVTRIPTDPALCLVASLTAVGLGQGDDARALVRLGIAAAPSPTDDETGRRRYLELLTLESMLSVGPIKDCLANATRAYDELPAGAWHSAASFALGFLNLGLGLDDIAEARLHEAATEAHVSGTATVWAASCALLAVIHGQRGEWAEATRWARDARQIAREHGLENMPTMSVVTAVSAHAEALEGDPTAARADMLLTRRNMAYLDGIGAWANVQSRLSLANASLLLGDRAGARVLVDEAETYLESQPDATGSRARLEEIVKRLEAERGALPVGPTALTTAELRVLHLLPTNLSIAEIAQRLYVSRNTVKSHAAAVYRKFGVSSRGEAVSTARDVGLLPPL